jgi:hypothetical protein
MTEPALVPNIAAEQITTAQWIDAYTAHLEGVAEATSSTALRKEMVKALDTATNNARADSSEENVTILQQQQDAMNRSRVGLFNREAFALVMQLWKQVAQAIKSAGFILSEDIDVEMLPSGEYAFSQFKNRVRCPNEMGQVFLAFVKFCAARSEESRESPNDYVKRVLAGQGITKDNWHIYADKTAIADPWADERDAAAEVRKIIIP